MNNGTADYDYRIEEFKVNTNLKHNCAAIPKVTELFHCFRLASILGKDDYQSCHVRIWYALNQGTPWPRTSRLARFLFFSYVKKRRRGTDPEEDTGALLKCQQRLPCLPTSRHYSGVNHYSELLANPKSCHSLTRCSSQWVRKTITQH